MTCKLLIPDFGHLEGHYPSYGVVTYQRKNVKTIYMSCVMQSNLKFFHTQ